MTSYSKKIISGKERKQIISTLSEKLPDINDLLPKKSNFARLQFSKSESLIVKNKEILLLEMKDLIFPHIRLVRSLKHTYPIIKVDTGAIKFVTNGADVMRPGITSIDDGVCEGALVLIVEETRGSPLAFGIAKYDAVDMRAMTGGKCIKNLHYLKDKYWEIPD